MTERTYPLPLPDATSADYRFTFGLADDIGQVLEKHGFPPVRSGQDRDDLMLALLGFIYAYAPGAPAADAVPGPELTFMHAMRPDGSEMPRCGAPRGSRIALFADNVTCSTCQFLLDFQLAGRDPSACPYCGDRHKPWCMRLSEAIYEVLETLPAAGYSIAELDGAACIKCRKNFGPGELCVPAALITDGPVVFAHPKCLPESAPTEPPGDAP